MKNELKKLNYKNFIMLTIAGFINSFGITVFLMPVNLYDSGISGTSMLLGYLTPDYLSLSIFLLVLNLPLFLYGLKRQGLAFTIYACYAVACYSFFSWLITDVLPIDVSLASPLAENDLVLCSLFGGVISGVGSGASGTFRRSYGRYRGAGGNIFEKTRHDCRHVRYDLQRDTLHSLRIHI